MLMAVATMAARVTITVQGSACNSPRSCKDSSVPSACCPSRRLQFHARAAGFSLASSPSSGAVSSASRSPGVGKQKLYNIVADAQKTETGRSERSYIMIKPDGVHRGLVGEIISRFERKGFTLKGLKLFQTPQELAEEHYGELKERPFFPNLVKYIISGPVVAMVWEGPGVVASARKLIGVTNPLHAEPGTIRGDFGVTTGRNVVHGSDSAENGEREIALWFKEGELVEWEPSLTPWIFESN